MPDFASSLTLTESGPLTNVRLGDRSGYFLASTAMTKHPIIGPPIQGLSDGLTAMAESLEARAPDLTNTGFNKAAINLINERVKPAFNDLRNAVPKALANYEEKVARDSAPRFADDQPPAVRVELRQYARSLSLPALMEQVQHDPSLAAAVVEGGLAMSGLPADVFDRLRRDMALANAMRVFVGQRTYRTAPNANDPIGGKFDEAAARADAEEWINTLETEREMLTDDVSDVLARVIDIVAITADTTRDQAFTLLAA